MIRAAADARHLLTMLLQLLGVVSVLATVDTKGEDQRRLINDILHPTSYDRRVRPVRDTGHAINVTLRMNLYQILDVNEVNQNIQLYTWVTQMWNDNFLHWNPLEYDGINWTVLPYQDIWLPDTYLWNSVQMGREDSERWTNAVIRTNTTARPQTAHVRFMYPAIFTYSCKLNIQYFPFDKQNCTMQFGSWTYDASGIDFFPESDHIMMENYVENEEWRVISFQVFRHELHYTCCPYPYTLLYAHLVMQRKPLFYMANLVLPTAVITLVAIVGFFMPASTSGERTEKVNLGITTLLAMSILLLMVSDQMPTTSNFIPLIGWFYLNIILLISVGTLMTSVVIWVHEKGIYGKPVPKGVRTIFFNCLAKILRVPVPPELELYWKSSQKNIFIGSKRNRQSRSAQFQTKAYANNDTSETLVTLASNSKRPTSANSVDNRAERPPPIMEDLAMEEYPLRSRFDGSAGSFRNLRNPNSPRPSDQRLGVQMEWIYLANVIDRFLLIVFLITVFVVTFGLVVVGEAVREDGANET